MNLIRLSGELKRLEALVALALSRAVNPGPSKGVVNVIRIPVALVTVQSAATIPAGDVVLRAFLEVQTPYSTGATLTLGTAAVPAAFMAIGDSDPQIASLYDAPQDTLNAVANRLLVTIAGAPVAGAGFACVMYGEPLI